VQGAQGATGAQGFQGNQGTTGAQGSAGTSVTIIGTVPDVNVNPPNNPQTTLNTAYPSAVDGNGVIDETLGNLWVFAGGIWTNVGQVKGDSGTSGFSGAVGAQGDQGVQGAQGNRGFQGAQGAIGVQGAQGDRGFQGAQGDQGPQGFQGAQGVTGAQGAQGVNGVQGAQGAQGVNGVQGAQGTAGLNGAQGADGLDGAQGAQGFSGYSGYSGLNGFSGISGYSGYSGLDGFSGMSGFTGYSGYSGTVGFSGISGFSGFSGISGYSGSPVNISSQLITYSNSFSAGQVVRLDNCGSGWFLAQADSATNAEATGVIQYASAYDFYIVYNGLITFDQPLLSPGECYFLSPDVAGAVTTAVVSAIGTVSKPILRAVSSNVGVVVNERGILNSNDSALGGSVNARGVVNQYYTAVPTDYYIGVQYTGMAVVTLPIGFNGKAYSIKDMTGTANTTTNVITISATYPDNIDGYTFDTITSPFETVNLVYYGNRWNLI
jgi:hypothetical protein